MLRSVLAWCQEHVALLLIAVCALLYGRTIWFDFVALDDGLLIYENARVAGLNIRLLWSIFTSYDPELYIPFTLLSYQLNYVLAGFSPWIYHLTNVLLHIGSCYFVWRCLRQLMSDTGIALLGTLLFCVHPLQVETVAWAAARKDILSSFFLFWSFWMYLDTDTYDVPKRSLFLFIAALLSKVTVAPFPVILLCLEWSRGENVVFALRRKLLPFFGVSVVFGIIALLGKSGNIALLTAWEQLLLFCKSFLLLVQSLVWPIGLNALYEQRTTIELTAEFVLPVVLTLLFVGLCFVLWWKRYRTALLYLVGAFLFYVPVIATFAKGHLTFYGSDRYAYLSLFFAVGLLCYALQHSKRYQAVFRIFLAAVCIGFAGIAWVQTSYWKHTELFYRRALAMDDGSAMSRVNLGVYLMEQGRRDEGLQLYREALVVDPDYIYGLSNLANNLALDGENQEAETLYKRSITAAEERHMWSMEDAAPYYHYAGFLEQTGRSEAALAQFERAAERSPHLGEPHLNLGIQYQKRHRLQEAYDAFSVAIDLESNYVEALYRKAAVGAELGKLEESYNLLKTVQHVSPGFKQTERHLENLARMLR